MAEFMITSPDGRKFRVNAPQGASRQDAIAYAQKQFGGQQPKAATSSPTQAKLDNIDKLNRSGQQTAVEGGLQKAGVAAEYLKEKAYQGLETSANQPMSINPSARNFLGMASATKNALDLGSSAVSGVLSAAGQLPSFSGRAVGEDIGNEVSSIAEANPRLARNLSAAGSVLSVTPIAAPVAGGALAVAPKVVDTAMDVGKGTVKAAGNISTLPKIAPEVKKVAQLAVKYDIPLGLDDLTDGKFYKTLISEGESVPFSGSTKYIEKQNKSFNREIAKSIGLSGQKPLTPELVDKAYTRIGKKFDKFTKGKTFEINDTVLTGLDDIREIAKSGGYGPDGEKIFDGYLQELYSTIDETSKVKGESLSKVRSKLNAIGRKGSNLDAKALASQMESVIADFITDGAPKALRDAKYQYKNFITIEPLVRKDQIGGLISPAALAPRVATVWGRQFTRGKAGTLGDLARIGQLIKEKVPNSGTAQRTAARNVLTGSFLTSPTVATFINPALGATQAAVSGIGVLANRGLQSRNYNPKNIEKVIKRSK